jgi:hypothetical protein
VAVELEGHRVSGEHRDPMGPVHELARHPGTEVEVLDLRESEQDVSHGDGTAIDRRAIPP